MPIVDTSERVSPGATCDVSDRYLLNMERLYRGASNTPVINTPLRWSRLKALRKELKRRNLKPLPAKACNNIITLSEPDIDEWQYIDGR